MFSIVLNFTKPNPRDFPWASSAMYASDNSPCLLKKLQKASFEKSSGKLITIRRPKISHMTLKHPHKKNKIAYAAGFFIYTKLSAYRLVTALGGTLAICILFPLTSIGIVSADLIPHCSSATHSFFHTRFLGVERNVLMGM